MAMWSWILSNGPAITAIGGAIAIAGVYITQRASDEVSDQLVVKSEEIAAKSDEIAELNRRIADHATGAGSYIYVHVEGFGSDDPKLWIRTAGENPIRGIEVLIYDVSDPAASIGGSTYRYALDELEPYRARLDDIDPRGLPQSFRRFVLEQDPEGNSYSYFILFNFVGGPVRQELFLRRHETDWAQAYRVQRILRDGGHETLEVYRGPNYADIQRAIARDVGNEEQRDTEDHDNGRSGEPPPAQQ